MVPWMPSACQPTILVVEPARPVVIESARPVDVERDRAVGEAGAGLGRRRAQVKVGGHRRLQSDVVSGRFRQQPLLLEDVTVGLQGIPVWTDCRDERGQRRLKDVLQPACRRVHDRDRLSLLVLQPALVFTQVVEQEASLALERQQAGQLLELVAVEPPVGDGHPQPNDLRGRPDRLEHELVDREAKLVETTDPRPDGVPVAGRQLGFQVELLPDRAVASPDRLRGGHRVLEPFRPVLHRREVRQAERHVLDEDVQVVATLSVGQRRMDLAGLGVDQVGLDLVAVPAEQGVGQRAVPPVEAGAMEIDQERCHRVEEAIAVRTGAERKAHQQAPVLDRVGEVFGDEDGAVPFRNRRQADRQDRRQARVLEMAQDVELGGRDLERLFLQGERQPVDHEEPDQVPRRADRQVAEVERRRRPARQGHLPGQLDQLAGAVAQPEPREPGRGGRLGRLAQSGQLGRSGQSFLRR